MQPEGLCEQPKENGKGNGEKTERVDAGKEENRTRAEKNGEDQGEYERKQKSGAQTD